MLMGASLADEQAEAEPPVNLNADGEPDDGQTCACGNSNRAKAAPGNDDADAAAKAAFDAAFDSLSAKSKQVSAGAQSHNAAMVEIPVPPHPLPKTHESRSLRILPLPTTTKNIRQPSLPLQPGSFYMGTPKEKVHFQMDGEGPVRRVRMSGFILDKYEVSNAKYKEFVTESGYTTEAEGVLFAALAALLLAAAVQRSRSPPPNRCCHHVLLCCCHHRSCPLLHPPGRPADCVLLAVSAAGFGDSFVAELWLSKAVSATIDKAVAAVPLAVGETIILMTPIFIPIETPNKGRGGAAE